MKREIVSDNEVATLWYYPDEGIVHHHFKKYAYGSHFRDTLEKGSEIFEQRGADKWLSDDRNNGALRAEDGEWGESVWVPRVMAAGWKAWAMVLPEKVIGKMNAKKYIELNASRGITVEIFSDPDEALKWLASFD